MKWLHELGVGGVCPNMHHAGPLCTPANASLVIARFRLQHTKHFVDASVPYLKSTAFRAAKQARKGLMKSKDERPHVRYVDVHGSLPTLDNVAAAWPDASATLLFFLARANAFKQIRASRNWIRPRGSIRLCCSPVCPYNSCMAFFMAREPRGTLSVGQVATSSALHSVSLCTVVTVSEF